MQAYCILLKVTKKPQGLVRAESKAQAMELMWKDIHDNAQIEISKEEFYSKYECSEIIQDPKPMEIKIPVQMEE